MEIYPNLHPRKIWVNLPWAQVQTFLDKNASHLAYFLEELYIAFAHRELIDHGSA